MHAISTYLVIFVGAGTGGALRHGVNLVALRNLDADFPYGTLAVNVIGSLGIGLLAGWFAHKLDPGQLWRLFLTTGVLGGFTTFSAFSLEAALLYERGQFLSAGIYVFASVGLSILAVFGGLTLVRTIS